MYFGLILGAPDPQLVEVELAGVGGTGTVGLHGSPFAMENSLLK